jgi:small-conductance mechanosensitive channel
MEGIWMSESLTRALIAAGIALGSLLLGYIFRRFAAGRLHAIFKKSASDLDDLLLDAFRPHVPLWFFAGGLIAMLRYLGIHGAEGDLANRVILAAVILSITLGTSSFAGSLVARRASAWGGSLGATTLTQNAVRIVVVSLGALVVLSNLGIAITPILTALGVGSLAVALALQPTLTNLFAGIHISLAQQIRVGDYVELETGQQGFIADIGWRSTHIRELPNNLILIPNARLAEIIVRNYSLPEPEQAVLVQAGVSYNSDLAQVERVTCEVAKEVISEQPGGVTEFDPFIRFHTFGDSSINFTIILRGREFPDRYALTHEFVKRLHARYAKEGIEIPFPQRVVHMRPTP